MSALLIAAAAVVLIAAIALAGSQLRRTGDTLAELLEGTDAVRADDQLIDNLDRAEDGDPAVVLLRDWRDEVRRP